MGERIGGNRTAVGVKQRVSIACAHDGGDRKNPVGSRLIFDDDRLLPTESQSLGEQAGRNVSTGAGRKWRDDPNIALRPGFGKGGRRKDSDGGRGDRSQYD